MSVKILKVLKNLKVKSGSGRSRGCGVRSLHWLTRPCRYTCHIDSLPTRYGGKTNITVLPGVGVGPEIMTETLKVLQAAEAPLSYEVLTISADNNDEENSDFENIITSILRNKVALKGNIEIRGKDPQVTSRNVTLRKRLDVFGYILEGKTLPGLHNKFGDINITVIRQNTEGEYLMLEHEPIPGSVESLTVITDYNSKRIANFAFNFAIQQNRKKITVVHGTYFESLPESTFVKATKKVAEKFPEVQMNTMTSVVAIVKMIKNPNEFDIILTTNLHGSIISNFLSGMCGGPGLTTGINLNEDGIAIFEPGARNKGTTIMGQGIANPLAMIMSAVNLLEYLGYNKTADIIRTSVYATLVEDKVLTQDLGGRATTKEITENIISHIRKQLIPKTIKRDDFRLPHRWKSYCKITDDKSPQRSK